jgi:bifunctional DNA-binding transcriptional regulator/antitoxin component of YhaV-PrlF toxin-antitoxin module
LTIPAGIRRKMGIEEGGVFSLIQVGDTLVATRKKLVAQEVATALEGLMREQGVTLADLLDGLENQREAYVREKYGIESYGVARNQRSPRPDVSVVTYTVRVSSFTTNSRTRRGLDSGAKWQTTASCTIFLRSS